MIKLSGNNFVKAVITKSGNTFTEFISKSTNTFSKLTLSKSLEVPAGDNTTSAPYGGDFGTYGEIYGEENYGGTDHFKNRVPPPGIAH